MKLIFTILAVIFFTLIAGAVQRGALADNLWITPPQKWVHPFQGKVSVQTGPYWQVWPKCGGLVYGCAFMSVGICTIVVWDKYYNHTLFNHELAHCNGWPWNHPLS